MNFAQAQEIRSKLDEPPPGRQAHLRLRRHLRHDELPRRKCLHRRRSDGRRRAVHAGRRGRADVLSRRARQARREAGLRAGRRVQGCRRALHPHRALAGAGLPRWRSSSHSLYNQIVDDISGGRSVAKSEVMAAIDRAMTNAKQAKQLGLVDHLADADGLSDVIDAELGDSDKEPRIDATSADGRAKLRSGQPVRDLADAQAQEDRRGQAERRPRLRPGRHRRRHRRCRRVAGRRGVDQHRIHPPGDAAGRA